MYSISKRIFDIIFSLVIIIVLSPLFIVVALLIVSDSKGGVFYKQIRVGRDNKEFGLLKFRSMRPDSDKNMQITIGNDSRITRIGHFIRRYKIDEFPQIINILKGEMSVVGPRPEVRKYVQMYNAEQLTVLSVKPGLTDFASVEYFNEQELLGKAENPEEVYINEIMPAKLNLNLKYVKTRGLLTDFKIILQTFLKILR